MLRPITDEEIPAVARLMNQAYRSTGSVKSWNTEDGILEGERTNQEDLRVEIAASPQGSMLVWKRQDELLGCVWVEPTLSASVWYLGSLAVDPALQQAGVGRSLLQQAEDWITAHGGTRVEMTVLNVRSTLVEWYSRRGYHTTGLVKPFPYGDNRFGKPLRDDLTFLVLAKQIP